MPVLSMHIFRSSSRNTEEEKERKSPDREMKGKEKRGSKSAIVGLRVHHLTSDMIAKHSRGGFKDEDKVDRVMRLGLRDR